jgi:hypothetical protein
VGDSAVAHSLFISFLSEAVRSTHHEPVHSELIIALVLDVRSHHTGGPFICHL